ncbi:DUF6300 family protein [Streptomyces rhizosphaerihabitans]|uniref:DUF6300 family protein n=1 Tax=Streptomyces rhizosphaerihabitans TaxID=1266770 RepID=UPI003703F158
MLKKDTGGLPILPELCRDCDADKPAAAALIRFFTADVAATSAAPRRRPAPHGVDEGRHGRARHGRYWAEDGQRRG